MYNNQMIWARADRYRAYILPLLFALIVGSLSILPHILAVHRIGNAYQGYPFLYQANEDMYMARVQEVVDGHPLNGSPVLYEYKEKWPTTFPVAENLYAIPSILFHIPLTNTIVAAKFFLPVLLFLLVYTLVLAMASVKNRTAQWNAVAAALLVTLGYDIVDYKHLPALLTGSLGQTNLLVWTRPINPISGALLLFSLVIIVWKILSVETKWLFIMGGLLLGASIGYFFSWFIGSAIVGLSFLLTLYQKEFAKARRLAGILVISLIVQIPYWYHSLQSFGSTAGKAIAMKNGAEYMHTPIINKFLLAITLVYIFCLAVELHKGRLLKNLELWWLFTSCLLVACWVAFNVQVITGITIWPYHFVQYTILISIVVLFVTGNNYIAPRFQQLWRLTIIVAIVLSLSVGIMSVRSYEYRLNDFAIRQSYMPIFAWINSNAPKDCVVLVDEPTPNFEMLIPAFTYCNVYINTYTPYNIPQERILHNMLVLLRLQNVSPQDVRTFLEIHPLEVNGYMYESIDQSLFGGLNAETQRNIDILVPAYQDFYKKDFTTELKKYRIDYLLTTSPAQTLPKSVKLNKEISSGTLTLYKIE